MISDKLLTF